MPFTWLERENFDTLIWGELFYNNSSQIYYKIYSRNIHNSLILDSERIPIGEEVGSVGSQREVAFDGVLRLLHLIVVGVQEQHHVLVRYVRQVRLTLHPGKLRGGE